MATIIDTDVLVEIAVREPQWVSWSRRAVLAAVRRGPAIINRIIIYAEFSLLYARFEDVDALLPAKKFRREQLPWRAAFGAARALLLYRRAGGGRSKPLRDFLIGAHAAVRGYEILTRDPSGFQTHFSSIPLVTPDTHP